ncbi:MAG TPA: RES family NAD+ phosphorylase [Thermoanaerobaculia bacterium]
MEPRGSGGAAGARARRLAPHLAGDVIVFRHADPRFPFLWESPEQPSARWHLVGEGPVQYLADTPDGAWAELLRHEEITEPEDLSGVRRSLWAVELPEPPTAEPKLPATVLHGPPSSHPRCRREAARLRSHGVDGLRAPSAALLPGGATGWRVDGGLQPGQDRDGVVFALFGPRPELVGWRAVEAGHPAAELLDRVRHF